MESEVRDNVFEMRRIDETDLPPANASDLDEPRWSVVSFDQREASGLTYHQAVELITELDSHSVAGLCLVTDEAASRMRP
jgi:hypothetical protein